MPRVQAFTAALLAIDRVGASGVLQAASRQASPIELVEALVVPALDEIGRGWEDGTVALSQVYMAARICDELLGAIPELAVPFRPDRPRLAIAALDDHHLLGKKIVQAMMRASGYNVADYGVLDAPALIARAVADDVEVLMISVLMLRSALQVRQVREGLDAAGARTRLVVGGAPFRFDPALWREVRADACGLTASDAVALAARFSGVPA